MYLWEKRGGETGVGERMENEKAGPEKGQNTWLLRSAEDKGSPQKVLRPVRGAEAEIRRRRPLNTKVRHNRVMVAA